MCIRRFSPHHYFKRYCSFSRASRSENPRVNLASAKSQFKRPKFKRSRNSAKSSSRKKMEKIFVVKIVDETNVHERSYILFLRAITLKRRSNRGFFSRRRNRARLSWTGDCGFFFFFLFFSISQFERFNFITMDVRWETSSRSLGLFRACVGDQLFSYL